jgi:ATP-dependent Clp protease ATP-binding subunit ClpA
MFERFTRDARLAVMEAQQEARVLGDIEIGTEHLLLGLLTMGGGPAAGALAEAGVTAEGVRELLEQRSRRFGLGPGEVEALASIGIDLDSVAQSIDATQGDFLGRRPKHIPFTVRAKRSLELALREALSLAHNYIGTEHILLGMLRLQSSGARDLLVALDADPETLRRSLRETIKRAS